MNTDTTPLPLLKRLLGRPYNASTMALNKSTSTLLVVLLIGCGDQASAPLDGGGTDANRMADAQLPTCANLRVTRTVVDNGFDIVISGVDGTDESNLVDESPERESEFGWSSDGLQFAYYAERGDTRGIYAKDLSGTPERELWRLKSKRPSQPRWSPDGSSIVFRDDSADGSNFDLMLLNVSDGQAEPLADSRFNEDSAEWSPDGTAIVYRRKWDVLVTQPSSGDVTVVATDVGAQPLPHWAGNAAIVYIRGGDLWKYDLVSGAEQNLTESIATAMRVAVSTTGTRFAIVSQGTAEGDFSIGILDESGTLTPLTTVEDPAATLAWSADDSTLVFASRGIVKTISIADGATRDVGPGVTAGWQPCD